MLLNAARHTVKAHDVLLCAVTAKSLDLEAELMSDTSSRCPMCGADLIGKRGEQVIWHWAHRASGASREGCAWEESAWHLRMKSTYLTQAGWEAEWPITVAGQKFVIDAAQPKTGKLREFVHSLSPYYVNKHKVLKCAGRDVLWIWDGEEFVAMRARTTKKNGMRKMLKPAAFMLFEQIGGFVHWDNELWKHWKDNVFFPVDSPSAREMCDRYSASTVGPRSP